MKVWKGFATGGIGLIGIVMVAAGCGDGGGGAVVGVEGGDGEGLAKGTFTKTVVDNDASSVGNTSIFYTAAYEHYMYLYLADDIAGSGMLESISLRTVNDIADSVNCPNLTVRVGHTNVAALTATFADNVETGQGSLETVIDAASVTAPAASAGDYYAVKFEKPFNYNGKDNLIIDFERPETCDGSIGNTRESTAYISRLSTDVLSSPTGVLSDVGRLHMKFNFTGGDNELNFGDTKNLSLPFSTLNPRMQTIYKADEIEGSGSITGIAFQLNQASTESDVTYTLKLGHTTFEALSSTFADNFNSGEPVTVANNLSFTIPTGIQAGDYFWVPIPDGTFTYNGTDNLVVEIDVSAASWTTNLRYTSLEAGRRQFALSGNDVAFGSDSATTHVKFRFNGGTMDVITNGSGESNYPFSISANQRHNLYYGTEIGKSGNITHMALRLKSISSLEDTYSNFKVVFSHSTPAVLSGTFSDNLSDPFTVYSSDYTIQYGLKTGDWVKIPLSTPFAYDATKNLVTEVSTDGGSLIQFVSTGSTANNRYMSASKGSVSGTPSPNLVDLRLWIDN